MAPSIQSYGALSVWPGGDSTEDPSLSGFVRGRSSFLDQPGCGKLLLIFGSAVGSLESFGIFHYTVLEFEGLTLYSTGVFEIRTT